MHRHTDERKLYKLIALKIDEFTHVFTIKMQISTSIQKV